MCLASANLAGCVTDQAATANAAPAPAIAPGQAVVTITRTDSYQAALLDDRRSTGDFFCCCHYSGTSVLSPASLPVFFHTR